MNEEKRERETAPAPEYSAPETTRPDDVEDAPPPMNSPARGPMDQSTPDVATGSTPVTRHND